VSSDVKQDIFDSVEDISELLSSYDILFARLKENTPDKIELAALGTVLHSFYNGIEGIFLLVSKQIDKITPSDSAWHQSLLNQVTEKTVDRASLISQDTASLLAAYLKFRHFFRHAYAFMLDWNRIKPLADNLCSVWVTVKAEIAVFCDSL
jgi:hypothetical protein